MYIQQHAYCLTKRKASFFSETIFRNRIFRKYLRVMIIIIIIRSTHVVQCAWSRSRSSFVLRFGHGPILVQINLQYSQAQLYGCALALFHIHNKRMYYTEVIPCWLNAVPQQIKHRQDYCVFINKWLWVSFYFGVLDTICRPLNLMLDLDSAEKLAYDLRLPCFKLLDTELKLKEMSQVL